MVRISLVAIALGLISTAAMAQTPAAGGATGAAPTHDVGTSTPNSSQTGNGSTESSSMLEQRIKQQSAAGASSSDYNTFVPSNGYQAQNQAQMLTSDRMYRGHRVAITDEYGTKYDENGQRIQ